MPKESVSQMLTQAKPFVAVIFLQFGFAGMSIITKFALNQGMSQHVLVVYRNAVAFVFIAPFALVFDRYVRIISAFPSLVSLTYVLYLFLLCN